MVQASIGACLVACISGGIALDEQWKPHWVSSVGIGIIYGGGLSLTNPHGSADCVDGISQGGSCSVAVLTVGSGSGGTDGPFATQGDGGSTYGGIAGWGLGCEIEQSYTSDAWY